MGHSLPPAEFHAHFNDSEDMLLVREVSVLFSFRKRHYKEVCNYVRNGFRLICGETCIQWVGQVWDIDIKI